MKRRDVFSTLLVSSIACGCSDDKFLSIGWDEEVALHDGRVLLVTLNYAFERLRSGFLPSSTDPAILRATTLGFNASPSLGKIGFTFKKHRVNTIEFFQGDWYFILETRGGPLYIQGASGAVEQWGSTQDAAGHKCLRLDPVAGLVPVSLLTLPDVYLVPNILLDTAEVSELALFNRTTVTLKQKARYIQKFPLDPTETQIKHRMNRQD